MLLRTLNCASLVNKQMGMAVSYMFATPSFVQSTREKVLLLPIKSNTREYNFKLLDWNNGGRYKDFVLGKGANFGLDGR
jgi:hypothetical protein